ncbi:vesicle transport protein SFT2B-like [Xenia sp. Carnegie-2017]|uniref:vesicle transport protein SFT2B-like n=1 Tax=Xenia sp. Carnegie-2017 TaxID=2897299 RepID=UPI001F0388F4|nr:vesicle transport protein SFT2B-like [Xenia sp. Carnegie-2017]
MAPSTIQKLKSAVTGKENDENSLITEISDATTLSWSTRIKGFIICFLLGIGFTLLGIVMIFQSKYKLFAVFYTFGNLTALGSSFFLTGPVKQLKNMFKEKRLIATIVMLSCIALTLCAGLWWKNGGLAILFAILQYLAMTWYCLSYIPYARNAVKGCISNCLA